MNEAEIAAIIYSQYKSIKKTARVLGYSTYKTKKKLLVTAGVIVTEEAEMMRAGMSKSDISKKKKISNNGICQNTPYTKCVYKSDSPTENALRIRAWRASKK